MIFNSYVKLPEGSQQKLASGKFFELWQYGICAYPVFHRDIYCIARSFCERCRSYLYNLWSRGGSFSRQSCQQVVCKFLVDVICEAFSEDLKKMLLLKARQTRNRAGQGMSNGSLALRQVEAASKTDLASAGRMVFELLPNQLKITIKVKGLKLSISGPFSPC